MFDPAQSAALRELGPDGPVRANVAALTTLQREALVNLLCGSARHLPGRYGRRGGWIVPALGVTWAIEPATIAALAARELVAVSSGARASLTPRGLWYARSAVQHAVGDDNGSAP